MVICIVAMVVFSVLGIFSANYRKLAKEAFSCVMNMLVFKPCTTKFDERIKSKVTSKLMRMPALARFFYRNFKLLSLTFAVSFFGSMAYSVYGIYNLVVYGSCTPGSTCVITQGADRFIQFFTCYEAQIVYVIVVTMVAIFLIIRYLRPRAG